MVHRMQTLRALATAFAFAMGVARAADASGEARPATDFEGEGYRGYIGKAAVVMRLAVKEGRVIGHYFYEKYGVDIALSGTWADMHAGSEQFVVTRHDRNGLSGEWRKGDKRVPFRLKHIPRDGVVRVFKKHDERIVHGTMDADDAEFDTEQPAESVSTCITSSDGREAFGLRNHVAEAAVNESTMAVLEKRALDDDCVGDSTESYEISVEVYQNRWATVLQQHEFDQKGYHRWIGGTQSGTTVELRSGLNSEQGLRWARPLTEEAREALCVDRPAAESAMALHLVHLRAGSGAGVLTGVGVARTRNEDEEDQFENACFIPFAELVEGEYLDPASPWAFLWAKESAAHAARKQANPSAPAKP